ncbi:MAG: alpha-L-rhamnosidase C-terminal domain-containing protein [Sphaerochaeta sp.]
MHAQNNLLHDHFNNNLQKDEITRSYVTPIKIVWQSDHQDNQIKNAKALLTKFDGQLSTSGAGMCMLKSDDDKQAAILLDFGTELYGGIEIAGAIRGEKKPVKVRIRLGESASEAMSDAIDNSRPGMQSATNEHSLRDFTLEIPWLGTVEIGNSGFRFVRIDLLDKEVELPLRSVRAIARYRDIPYLGSFKSSDERLNKIWETGAYTVHLNMQDYLWDGIKRDRLVWVGDMHPEVMTINSVFGDNEVVRKSLDFARDTTPLPGWMNGISSYSLWWIIIHRDYYLHQGDLNYLREQQSYLNRLIPQITARITEGKENLDGGRFLDWPTAENEEVIHSGLQALTMLTMEAGADIATWLGDHEMKNICQETAKSLQSHKPSDHGNKQAAALLYLADLIPGRKAANTILKEGANDFATFYGYYMLEALAKAGRYEEAMEIISDYWGAMLDLGATTFWENFDYSDRANASRIDQLTPADRFDIHADGGDHCYIGLRGSLCHGWASGPTSWLTEHVLGIKVIEPGSKVIQIRPNLGDLMFAEGTFPTPYGIVKVKHVKQADGKVNSEIDAPEEVKIIR